MSNKIVAVNGCFDVVHVGHIRYLAYAAQFGDVIVGLNSDASVRALKGETRPVNNQDVRRELLLSIKYVKDVVIFNEKTAVEFLKQIKPQIWIKGGDYSLDTLDKEEVSVVKSFGGEIKIFPMQVGYSSSFILKKIHL